MRLAKVLKFRLQQVEVLYHPGSKQQRRWSDCADAQPDLRLCCLHIAKTGFLMMRLIGLLITNFGCCISKGSPFRLTEITTAVVVQCGGSKKSPRTSM